MKSNAVVDVAMHSNNDALSLDQFDVLETIGTGSFARVRLVRWKRNRQFYALKIMNKALLIKLQQVEHVVNEVSVLRTVQHPGVANLVGTFQDTSRLYMLLEHVPGGELFNHLCRVGRFPTSTVQFYIASLTLILSDLHQQRIVYRDLKPENVMLDENGYLRLTDFGFAKKVKDKTWSLCGTPEYLAPEVIQSRGHGPAVDFWSLGILFYELLHGYPPFADDNPFVIYQQILAGRFVCSKTVDLWAKDLIRKLLTTDESKRIGNLVNGVEDVKQHRFFKGFDWQALAQGNGEMRAPIVPNIRSPSDTSYFRKYRESVDDTGDNKACVDTNDAFASF